MNDWDYHKKEFIKLGGIAQNIICREGSNGRGIFRERKSLKPKILCPSHLLIKAEDLALVDDKFYLRNDASYSGEVRQFIENYYQDFSWGINRREEIKIFVNELSQIPAQAKILFLKNKLCPKHLLLHEPNKQQLFLRFANSRCVSIDKKPVFAPIWELVNHSSLAGRFKTSELGIETPSYPLDFTNNEIFHSYQQQASPISTFFNYGFANDEFFAYSLPTEIKIPNIDLLIRINGKQSNFIQQNKGIVLKDNGLLIPALPLGSISKQLPQILFYSIVGQYGIGEHMAADIVYQLQLANLDQRKRILDTLNSNQGITIAALIESIKKEIVLIENSLHAV